MASHKRHSSGIALLSVYDDDEEEDDMEQDSPLPQTLIPPLNDAVEEFAMVEDTVALQQPQLRASKTIRTTLTIVDYAHDEFAMSPDPAEEGEILATGRVTYGEELQVPTGKLSDGASHQTVQDSSPNMQTSPQSSDRNDLQGPNAIAVESGPGEAEEDITLTSGEANEVDPLANFLPPLPNEKCSEELQKKIGKFLGLKKSGRSYNAEVRKKKEYRNPDFLLHAVTYQAIDQIGSCFNKDVFDPHGYDESDFYDALEADTRHELERKEQERKKSQKMDFISGGSQPGTVIPTPKLNFPISAANLPPAAADGGRDGRANKKSKWDKVDEDAKSQFASGAQEALSAVLRTTANVGSGYSAFAQQRRREAEDKRSERKLEKRS